MFQCGQGRSNRQWEGMGLVRNTSKTDGRQGEEGHKVHDFPYEIRTKATMTFIQHTLHSNEIRRSPNSGDKACSPPGHEVSQIGLP